MTITFDRAELEELVALTAPRGHGLLHRRFVAALASYDRLAWGRGTNRDRQADATARVLQRSNRKGV